MATRYYKLKTKPAIRQLNVILKLRLQSLLGTDFENHGNGAAVCLPRDALWKLIEMAEASTSKKRD